MTSPIKPLTSVTAHNLLSEIDPAASVQLAASSIYPNSGLHEVARSFADAHPRAVDYLSQAPVMALSIDLKTQRHRMRSWFQLRVTGVCERQGSLKQMMAEFRLPYPLRRIAGSACEPRMVGVIAALARLDATVLGRVVPEGPSAQRRWLRELREWNNRLRQRNRGSESLAWAAEVLTGARLDKGEAADLADFASSPDSGFNPVWRLARAREEMRRWHGRLTVERILRGSPVTPDTVIDFGKHPDVSVHNGLEFVALRTPVSLAEEGAQMRHCVGTYVQDVIRGRCSIVGVRQGQTRVATIELVGGQVLQIKGPCNATVSPAVLGAAREYVDAIALPHSQDKAA